MSNTPTPTPMLPCPNPFCAMPDMQKIKYCFVHSQERERTNGRRVFCGWCGLEGPACMTVNDAFTAWNTRPQSQGSDEGVRLALKKDNEIAWDLYHAIEKFLGEWASVQNVHVPENLADLHLSFCEVELPTNKHEVEAQLKGLNHV